MRLLFKRVWEHQGTPYLIILILIGVQLGIASRFLAGNHLSSGCDVMNHLRGQLVFFEQLANWADRGIWGTLAAVMYAPEIGPFRWPRMTYLVSSLSTVLFGPGPTGTILFTNTVFTLILFISLLKLGERLAAPKSGLLACVLLTLCPGFIEFFRRYGLDFPLMCIGSLSIWLLLNTDGFHRRRASILFGLSCGLVLFTKLQGVFLLAGPVGFVAVSGWINLKGKRGEPTLAEPRVAGRGAVALNLALVFVISGGAALLLLYPHLEKMWLMTRLAFQQQRIEPLVSVGSSVSAPVFYLSSLFLGLSPLLFMLALAALFRIKQTFEIWVVIIPPVLLFSLLFSFQWSRFLLPVYPFIILAVADLLLGIWRKQRWRSVVVVVLGFSLVQAALLIPNHGTGYQNLMGRMEGMGLSTGGFSMGSRSFSSAREHFDWFAHQLRPLVGDGRTVLIGVLEDPRLGVDSRSILEFLTRERIPRARLIFIGSGANPAWFFNQLRQMEWVIGLSKGPEFNIPALMRKYQDRSWTRRYYRYVEYQYDQALVTQGVQYLEKMPRIIRQNNSTGVRLHFLKKPPLPAGG